MARSQQGFTIIELMVTLAVLAVVLGIAIPSFKGQIERNSSLGLGEEFVSALNFARTEAIKRRGEVSICASNAANNACATSADWANGWLVYVDSEAETSANTAIDGTPLRNWNDLDQRAVMNVARVPEAPATPAAVSFIRFNSRGMLARIVGAGVNDKIEAIVKLNACSGASARKVSVGRSGMVITEVVDC